MVSEFKISFFTFMISLMLSYDILRAGHTYLHLVGFHRTFDFGHFNIPDNLIDFLIKYSCVNGVLALVCVVLSGIASMLNFNQHESGISTILTRCIWSHMSTYIIFVGLFTRWVAIQYKDESMVHTAVLFAVVYLMSRVLLVVGDLVGYYMEFSYLRYPGYALGIVLNVMMFLEIVGVRFIDTVLG